MVDAMNGDVPIVAQNKGMRSLIDGLGTVYYELGPNVWCPVAHPQEGEVGYHGAGSHGGHIVLKPLFLCKGGRWVNAVTGRPHSDIAAVGLPRAYLR